MPSVENYSMTCRKAQLWVPFRKNSIFISIYNKYSLPFNSTIIINVKTKNPYCPGKKISFSICGLINKP